MVKHPRTIIWMGRDIRNTLLLLTAYFKIITLLFDVAKSVHI